MIIPRRGAADEGGCGSAAGEPVPAVGAVEASAVQALLGHESISTTGDVYTDWDIERLRVTLREVSEGEE